MITPFSEESKKLSPVKQDENQSPCPRSQGKIASTGRSPLSPVLNVAERSNVARLMSLVTLGRMVFFTAQEGQSHSAGGLEKRRWGAEE